MLKTLHADSTRLNRFVEVAVLIDLVVLATSLFVSCRLLSFDLGGSLFTHMLAYSTILLAFMDLSRRAIANCCKSIADCTRQILGNAIGIVIGTCIMFRLENLFSNHSDSTPAIILSGVIAFFVMGTICPLVHKASSIHQ